MPYPATARSPRNRHEWTRHPASSVSRTMYWVECIHCGTLALDGEWFKEHKERRPPRFGCVSLPRPAVPVMDARTLPRAEG